VKIIGVEALAIEGVHVVRFARFRDARGYFTEHYRKSDFANHAGMTFMKDVEFVQGNESFSRAGTIRGMHFQWNPFMGKLVRTVSGRMIDLVLDIRKGSPTFGRMIAWDMPANPETDAQEWIWVPPGFAHGNFFPEDSVIEYLCSGEYSPGCEAGISPLAADIDWSLCEPHLKRLFDGIAPTSLITPKDRDGLSVAAWNADARSGVFVHGR
jgi:dTDP-4-dehydrorhamnose 3,5-epimerase